MYPNQQEPPTYSIDYLNQIAPQAPKKNNFSRKQWIIIACTAALIVIVGIMSIVASAGGNSSSVEQLAAKLIATEKIVGDAQSKIKSSQLRTLNSNLNIYLTNTNRDIAAPLLADGIAVAKLDKKVLAAEAGTDITNRLEDARLNAIYDRVYAREISYQLEVITALMQQTYSSTKNQSLKAFLEGAFTNLEPTQKQFADFNAING